MEAAEKISVGVIKEKTKSKAVKKEAEGICLIDNNTHKKIGYSIKQSCDQHQGSDYSCCNSCHICTVNRQE